MKKYHSKDWLYLRFVIQGKSIDEIAEECNSSSMTVRRYLLRFGFIQKRDNPRKLYGRYGGKEIR